MILLAGAADAPNAVGAVCNGAVDFPAKPFVNTVLVERVRRVFMRATEMYSESRAEYESKAATFTPRERDVFHRMISGKANKVIAGALRGRHRTIETHRARVMSKMQAVTRAHLVRMAHEADLGA